jgi:hypothetical protein
MHRIRKMRETPNVPLSNHEEQESGNPSPSSSIENYTGIPRTHDTLA